MSAETYITTANFEICESLSSEAVCDHLIGLEYEFEPEAALWVIQRSKKFSLHGKANLWKTFVEGIGEDRLNDQTRELSRRWLELSEELEKQFMRQDFPAVYLARVEYRGGYELRDASGKAFSGYRACLEAIKHVVYEDEDYTSMISDGSLSVEVLRLPLDGSGEKLAARLNKDAEIVSISCESYETDLPRKNGELWFDLERGWFDIPVPFEVGDIVQVSDLEVWGRQVDEPMVLEELAPEFYKAHPGMGKLRDSSDMYCRVYMISEYRFLPFLDHGPNYIDLDWYEKPLDTQHEVLKFIGAYLKGKLEFNHLLDVIDAYNAKALADRLMDDHVKSIVEGLDAGQR